MGNILKYCLFFLVVFVFSNVGLLIAQCPVNINSISTTSTICNGTNSGTITVNISGGFAPYSYTVVLGAFNQSFTSNNTSFTFTSLQAASTYIILVDGDADGNPNTTGGCSGATQTGVTISEAPLLVLNSTSSLVLCSGQSTGSATVNISGGSPPYSISWNTLPIQTSQSISNLSVGSYTATVIDGNGCSDTSTTNVTAVNPIVITPSTTNVSCNGTLDGSISTNIIGGTQPYSFSWNTTPVQNTQNAINLGPGTYLLTVTDANGCSQTFSSTITQPNPINIALSGTNVFCNGGNDGSISSNVTGGTNPYTFSWNTNPSQTTPNLASLTAGNYILTLTDGNGCIASANQVVTQPNVLSATTSSSTILCNGASTGTATATPTGGTAPYTHSWNTNPVQTTVTATNMAAGTYLDNITDANGCSFQASVVVSQNSPIVIIPSTTNVSCFGGNNGSASVLASGGTAPLNLSWNTSPIQTGSVANNLTSGTYILTATDANGCIRNSSVTINQPFALVVSTNGQNASCNGICNGTANANVSGGTLPYSYSWNTTPTQSTQNISSLCAGSYSVTVTDGNGCISSGTRIVSEPTAILITTSVVNTPCAGVCTGSANANASGGIGILTYSWNTVPAQTSQSIANLCSGPYVVTVTDASGCSNTGNANVNNTSNLTLVATANSPVCNGACNGSITTVVAGGTNPITYQWSPNISTTTANANNLCAGTYTVTAIDANGCSFSQTVTLVQPPPVIITVNVSNLTCNGICNGTATTTVTGGQVPFTYVWSPNVSSGPNAANLCAGTYQVRVTDSNGCQALTNATISQPLPFSFNENVINPTCAGVCNGQVTTALTGGVAPYSYSWSPIGSSTSSVNNLCEGVYTLTITDASNCTSSNSYTIFDPTPISINSTATTAGCGQCNATATITPTGGTSPYTYIWSDGQTTASVLGLCSGVYSVNVTDVNGCNINSSIPISNSQGITNANLTTLPATCFGVCDGSASVLPSGGTLPYSILWIPGGQTTNSIGNQCAGNYFVQISDSNNCTITVPVTINEPSQIIPNSVTTVSSCGVCNGSISLNPTGGVAPYTYTWLPNVSNGSSASNLCAGAYQVTITGANGCFQTFTINVNSANGLSLNLSSADPTCNGGVDGSASVNVTGGTGPYTFLWTPGGQITSSVSGLAAGTYSVQVTDQTGCSIAQPVVISQPTDLGLSLIVSTNTTCFGVCDGSASVIPSGGTLPYSYLWLPGTSTTSSASNLCAGNYSVRVTDANGCQKDTVVSIISPSAVVATIVSTNPLCGGPTNCNGVAIVTANGGTLPYSSLWNTSPPQSGDTATGLCAGNYTAIVTDANGCTGTATVSISQPPQINLSFTNIVDLSCANICNGSASSLVNGGVPLSGGLYTYQWNDANNTTTSNVINLCAGTYTLIVTDANNCTITDSITINAPLPITLNSSFTNVTCSGLCDGQAIASVVSGGNAPFAFLWNDPASQTNDTASFLCGGTYIVNVQDASGCSASDTLTIINPQSLLLNVTTTNTQCGDVCSGSANAVVSGGTLPYTFIWNNGQTTQQADSLCSGLNFVSISDSNGCAITQNVAINSQSSLQITTVGGDVSCGGSCDGLASAFVSGGTQGYTYLWLNTGDTISNISGLCQGTYFVQVSDGAGCEIIDSVLVNGANIVANELIVNTLCGVCNGIITLNPSGGVAPYTFFWSNGDFGNSTDSLCAGLYSVTVTDASGCIETFDFSVINSNTSISVIANSAGLSCNGGNTGTATATVVGGTSPYTYIWSTSPQQNLATATSLSAGNYLVSVTDANGCVSSASVIVSEPSQIVTSISNLIDPSCPNTCDGEAIITAAGGSLPYSFVWLPNVSSTSAEAGNLCAGTYTAVLTDANGCQLSTTVNLNQPLAIASTTISVDASCNTLCNGTATVSVQGGNSPYTYQWAPSGGVFPVADSLCAGTYFVTITDAAGCTQTDTAIIDSPPAIVISTTVNGVTCNAACNGSASATVSGGIAPYSYSWNDFNNQTTQTALSLCTGSYTITVTDNNGCQDSSLVIVTDVNALQANITLPINATCFGTCNASAIANGLGGVPPYTYQWNDDLLQTSQTGSNLCEGTYICFVFDAAGCVSADTIILTQPSQLEVTANSTNATCGNNCNGTGSSSAVGGTPPYQFLWNDPSLTPNQNVSNLCAGIFTVVATDANGCNSLAQTTISQPSNINISGNVTNSGCSNTATGSININATGGTPIYSYNWQPGSLTTANVQNLLPNSYIVTVTDANNCAYSDTFEVLANIYVNANAGPDTTICSGENIVLTGSGGINYNWQPSSLILGSNLLSTVTAELPSTSNFLLVVQIDGCSDTDEVTITAALPDSINAGPDQSIIGGQATFLNATGSDNYSWLPISGLSDPNSPITQAAPDSTTQYVVFSTSANGCIAKDTVEIVVVPGISFPDGITPNDDGFNDTWLIDNLNLYPENSVEVFNRWGQSLFYSEGYSVPWDGKYNGKNLPVGTYYYVIDLKNGDKPLSGPITIVR